MERSDAMQLAVNAGAVVKTAVSRKTNYLVVGTQDNALVGDDGLSSKERDAYALNSKGDANIQIIREDEFIALATSPTQAASLITDDTHIQNTIFPVDSEEKFDEAGEYDAYLSILPQLQCAATEVGAIANDITFKEAKTYCSVSYDKMLAFRFKLRGNVHYIEIPAQLEDVFATDIPNDRKKINGDFLRISLDTPSIAQYADTLANVMKETINRIPKEWDCCSRYLECSNAKKCVHPDPSFALACGYRKVLASGKIFYGENRNID